MTKESFLSNNGQAKNKINKTTEKLGTRCGMILTHTTATAVALVLLALHFENFYSSTRKIKAV